MLKTKKVHLRHPSSRNNIDDHFSRSNNTDPHHRKSSLRPKSIDRKERSKSRSHERTASYGSISPSKRPRFLICAPHTHHINYKAPPEPSRQELFEQYTFEKSSRSASLNGRLSRNSRTTSVYQWLQGSTGLQGSVEKLETLPSLGRHRALSTELVKGMRVRSTDLDVTLKERLDDVMREIKNFDADCSREYTRWQRKSRDPDS